MALGNVFQTDSRNLPLYKSRPESGIGRFEPVYDNLFVAQIIPPASIQSDRDIMSAYCKEVSGISLYKALDPITQSYRGATRSYAPGGTGETHVDLTMSFTQNVNSSNQLHIYKVLKEWKNLVYNPNTGTRGLKIEYADGTVILDIHNRKGDVLMRITFFHVFITGELWNMSFNAEGGELVNLDGITFRSDLWTAEEL